MILNIQLLLCVGIIETKFYFKTFCKMKWGNLCSMYGLFFTKIYVIDGTIKYLSIIIVLFCECSSKIKVKKLTSIIFIFRI